MIEVTPIYGGTASIIDQCGEALELDDAPLAGLIRLDASPREGRFELSQEARPCDADLMVLDDDSAVFCEMNRPENDRPI